MNLMINKEAKFHENAVAMVRIIKMTISYIYMVLLPIRKEIENA